MSDTTVNDSSTAPSAPATEPPRTTADAPIGSGVMAARSTHEETTPQHEAIDRAAQTARTTGHRFDLLRYLRLRRNRAAT